MLSTLLQTGRPYKPHTTCVSPTSQQSSHFQTPEHVSDAVACAAAANLKVQAKGSGHSYASFSSGGQDGSVVVAMENFNTVN